MSLRAASSDRGRASETEPLGFRGSLHRRVEVLLNCPHARDGPGGAACGNATREPKAFVAGSHIHLRMEERELETTGLKTKRLLIGSLFERELPRS